MLFTPKSKIVFHPDDPPAGDPPKEPPAPPPVPPEPSDKPAFETWLEKQPEEVRKMYSEHTSGLTSALEKERKERKEYEKQLKRLEQLEAEEKKRQDAAKSEIEKAQDQLREAQEKARKLELKELQRQAAEKHKLPAALAARLQGETLEELEADAEALAKTLPKLTAPPVPPNNPGPGASDGETDDQRRARLFGSRPNIFDPKGAIQYGGGVVFPKEQ